MDQMCESMDKNRIQGVSVGRAGNLSRSPYPSRMRNVDSATVHGRQLNLPQEICFVSLRRLRLPKDSLTAEQKSAEGILGYAVGKASEALQIRKVELTDRPSRAFVNLAWALPHSRCSGYGGGAGVNARTRERRSSKPARPYIWRLMVFNRLI